MLTKKDKILQMFNAQKFYEGSKTFGWGCFRNNNLHAEITGGYDDVQYSAQILRKLGYKVAIGSLAMHVWENSKNSL